MSYVGATTFETLDTDEEPPARAERSHDDLVILYGVPINRRPVDTLAPVDFVPFARA